MKKILWLGIVISLLIAGHAFAAVSFTVSATDTAISAAATGFKGNTDTFRLVVLPQAFPPGVAPAPGYAYSALLFNSFDTDKQPDANGSLAWNLSGYTTISPATTYYVRVVEIANNGTQSYATAVKTIKTAGAAAGGSGTATNLPFTASASSTTITATLSGVTNLGDTYKLVAQKTPFSGDTYAGTVSHTIDITDKTEQGAVPAGGKTTADIVWSVPDYDTSTTYYVRALEIPKNATKPFYVSASQTVTTGGLKIFFNHLAAVQEGNYLLVTGGIDTAKHPNYKDFVETLTYSKSPDLSDPLGVSLPTIKGIDPSIPQGTKTCLRYDGSADPDTPGLYCWLLSGLKPGDKYYMQQTIKATATDIVKDRIETFDGGTGALVPPVDPNAAGGPNLNPNVYTLISKGFPGLTALPDPIECASQRAAAKAAGTAGPKYCDINDILNYFLKLLIGLSCVVLVFRLMFEGYQYMVTDTPFRLASAKAGFFSALGGLLLALTSFIILNTINPQLVNETVGLTQLSIGLPGSDGLGTIGTGAATNISDRNWAKSSGRKSTLTLTNGSNVVVTPCDDSQMGQVTAFGQSFLIQKNLIPSIKRIDAKWKQMSPQYPIKTVGGYYCRTIANSPKLSYHAYGMAIDINEDTNGVNTAGNMPQSFINIWKSEGWGWGGDWSSYKDPMHFSKGNSGSPSNGEHGDLKGE